MRTKIVLYFIAILAGNWSADAAEVVLRPQTHPSGSLVLLGDVAEVKSADVQRILELKRVELFPAPARQRSKLMHVHELMELLALHGIAIDDLEFTGARMTRIYAPAQEVTAAAAQLRAPAAEASAASDQVVVTRRALNRGDIIRHADIELQPVDSKEKRWLVATDLQAAVGMEVLSPIREGAAIPLQQLRSPLLVKRGEVIRVRARAAGVQVTTTARATEDGSLGDIILVQSLESREKYPTHVTGLQQVEVYATGVVAAEPARATTERPIRITEKR